MTFAVDGFDWDAGNGPKCAKHGVTREDIEAVFRGTPMILPDRTPRDRETRYNAIGKTAAGRMVFLVFTLRTRDGVTLIRPISARFMHRKEIEHYERHTGQ
ncbi:BrnT family toxin [Roseospira visakhapatnamensis]|uniref:BrnT family toxin n=1 Tax=Roseospira visakhapatnamensis TaxID=390880 RepID=A0A7W6WC75_9PROT|nr:BrnT family toxin [Roseospira visakhapatnamensis]MBB4268296.1 hypothetical protein [Roseospira visakhapatnamensis]